MSACSFWWLRGHAGFADEVAGVPVAVSARENRDKPQRGVDLERHASVDELRDLIVQAICRDLSQRLHPYGLTEHSTELEILDKATSTAEAQHELAHKESEAPAHEAI